MARKGGLGKGLDALIPSSSQSGSGIQEHEHEGGVTEISLAQIIPNPRQPRAQMDDAELKGLAEFDPRTRGSPTVNRFPRPTK